MTGTNKKCQVIYHQHVFVDFSGGAPSPIHPPILIFLFQNKNDFRKGGRHPLQKKFWIRHWYFIRNRALGKATEISDIFSPTLCELLIPKYQPVFFSIQ